MLQTITKHITRFDRESLANAFIKETAKTKNQRISDFGFESTNPEPYWVETETCITWESYTQKQLDRWKACGKFDHN